MKLLLVPIAAAMLSGCATTIPDHMLYCADQPPSPDISLNDPDGDRVHGLWDIEIATAGQDCCRSKLGNVRRLLKGETL